MASSSGLVMLEVKLLNTPPTRRSKAPLRSRASIVLAKPAGSAEPATAAISAACSAMPRSKAGGKCSGAIRAKGGNSNGVFQGAKNGLSVMRDEFLESKARGDCFVAALLAMTTLLGSHCERSEAISLEVM